MTKQPVSLAEFLAGAVEPYVADAARRNIKLAVRLDQARPSLDADPFALERIFANLLQNAITFTPDGG